MRHCLLKERRSFIDEDDCSSENPISLQSNRSPLKRCAITLALGLSLFVSLAFNLFSFVKNRELIEHAEKPGECPSRWAGLVSNVTKPLYSRTNYGSAASTQDELDKLWSELGISPGLVRLSDEFVEENGLPRSQRFPWDQSQGVYYIGAFHQIHCLKQIYFWMSDQERGVQPRIPYDHVLHCLDTLLQDVVCHADDTPWFQLPPEPWRQNYPKFQTRQCRDWESLMQWAGGMNSCFKLDVLDDDGEPVVDQFEHYKFCPEGSPYTEIMKEYFQEKAAKSAAT